MYVTRRCAVCGELRKANPVMGGWILLQRRFLFWTWEAEAWVEPDCMARLERVGKAWRIIRAY